MRTFLLPSFSNGNNAFVSSESSKATGSDSLSSFLLLWLRFIRRIKEGRINGFRAKAVVLKNAKKMKKKERERERREQKEYFPMFVHALFFNLLLLFSLVVNHAYSARVFGQPKRNSGERANDSKAAFVDSVSSSSASSALKNLPRELLARPTGGIRFLSFPLELLVVVENGEAISFYPTVATFCRLFTAEDPPPGRLRVYGSLVSATNGFKFLTKLNGESDDERLFRVSESAFFSIGVNGKGATRGSGSIVAGSSRRSSYSVSSSRRCKIHRTQPFSIVGRFLLIEQMKSKRVKCKP